MWRAGEAEIVRGRPDRLTADDQFSRFWSAIAPVAIQRQGLTFFDHSIAEVSERGQEKSPVGECHIQGMSGSLDIAASRLQLDMPLAGGRWTTDRVDGQVLARPASQFLNLLALDIRRRPNRANAAQHVRRREFPRAIHEGV